jgi:hypothetical protein
MTIVAATQQKDNWVQVVGEGKRTMGWLDKEAVSLDREEVTAAILATRKLREKDGLDYAKKVDAILAASSNPSSFFLAKLRDRAASGAQPATSATPATPATPGTDTKPTP